ncbi:MAG: sugar phosphate nucleotidyltransferase [Candidatus Paceibacterota bacterium]|jgi:glucose-1-phosphate thymidylyltransferase
MKGIILAGGSGSRLHPLTLVTNKHLLPVHDMPMIYYPILTLVKDFGIEDIIIATGGNSVGDIINLLGDGSQFGANFCYVHQSKAGGIAYALGLCRNIVKDDNMTVILGDNVFGKLINASKLPVSYHASVFLKEVSDPERFGVATIENNLLTEIIEKPKHPKSNLAVTGLYKYDSQVWEYIDALTPSQRGELEITDVNNMYLKDGRLYYSTIREEIFWSDAGTFDSLKKSTDAVAENRKNFHKGIK